MADVTIRRASREDAQQLRALAERLAAFPLPAWRKAGEIATADEREMLASIDAALPDDEVFVGQREGRIVGCLHMLATTDFFGRRHAHISVLAATAEAEGTGVGRALIAHAEHWTCARGLTMLTLNVFVANEHARAFYDRSGFAPETMKYVKMLE